MVPIATPDQEAEVPSVALLTPLVGPRDESVSHSGPSRDPDSTAHGPSKARALIEQARQALIDAEYTTHPVDRYVQAHRAALRAAAAVLAVRARPRRRARPTSAWTLLSAVAPELAEWAAFFAAASVTRAAAEAGVHRLVSNRDADDMVRQSAQFLTLAWRSATRTRR